MIIRNITSTDIEAVFALQRKYTQVFPGVRVVPADLYLSPAFHSGKDVFCAFEGELLLAYAPVYLQLVENGPIDLPHRAWVELKADSGLEDPRPVKDALYQELLKRVQELTRHLADRPVQMSFEYKPVECPAIDYAQSIGFTYSESLFGMERRLDLPIPEVPNPAGIQLRHLKMEAEKDQIAYVSARNECFPEAPVTLGEWQHILSQIIWPSGITIAAYAGRELVGNVSVFWNREEVAQSREQPGYTEYIFVRPAWQGRGIAKAMITEGLRFLKTNGLDMARLEVRALNEGALGIYKKLGYEVLAENRLYSKMIPAA